MKREPTPFSEIQDAFDFVSFGLYGTHAAYLCLETGKVFYYSEEGDNEEPLPEDIDDRGKFIAVPHKNDLDLGKPLVMAFAREYLPDDLYKIHEIFSRPGAYARFKDLLDHHGMIQQWHDFEEKTSEMELRRWCEDNDIEIND